MTDPTSGHRVTFRGKDHWITKDEILAVAAKESPRRVNSFFVEIDGKRYPPKQLIKSDTRPTKSFDSGAARRVLQALGFKVEKI